MARSKIYGGGGLTGQFLRDTAFSDQIGPGKFINRGLDTSKSAPPPPAEQVTPTFFASLVNDADATSYGDLLLPPTETRNSDAMYVQRDVLYTANENQIRQERLGVDGSTVLGTLMEPAGSNVSPQKTTFTNSTGMEVQNRLPSALSNDLLVSYWKATPADELHYVSQNLNGLISVNSTYSFSVFIRNTGEDAGAFRIQYQGGFSQARTRLYYDFVADDIDRVDNIGTNPTTLHGYGVDRYTDGWRRVWFVITINFDPFPSPGAGVFLAPLPDVNETGDSYDGSTGNYSAYVTGLSVAEENVLSSYIHGPEGAASSRAIDQLSWPSVDSQSRPIVNQAEGMAAMLWRPRFSHSDVPGTDARAHLLLSLDNELFYFGRTSATVNRFGATSQAVGWSVTLTSLLAKDEDYLLLLRWAGANGQVGYKNGGVVTWGTSSIYGGWADGGTLSMSLPGEINLPASSRNIYFWGEDKGTAWLESFFSGVAN